MCTGNDSQFHLNPKGLKEAMERALSREDSDEGQYFEGLKAVITPVLHRPEALGDLLELAEKYDPQGVDQILSSIKAWMEFARRLVEQREASPKVIAAMASRTLAELFFRQGHLEEAKRIYRVLIQRNPDDKELKEEYQKRFCSELNKDNDQRLLEALTGLVQRIKTARAQKTEA